MSDDDDVVGYKKPPKRHQFKKGVSGNPRGARAKPKEIATLINLELNEIVTLKEGGKELRIPKREAIVKRLVNSALSGQLRAIDSLVKYCEKYGVPDPFVVTPDDARILDDKLRRLRASEMAQHERSDTGNAEDGDGGGQGDADAGALGGEVG